MDKEVDGLLKVFAKGSLILLVGNFLSTVISSIGSILVARALGAAKFGEISVAQVPISFAFLFLTNGIQSTLINYISEFRHNDERDKIKSYIRTGAMINLTLGFLLSFIFYISAGFLATNFFNQPDLEFLIQILSFTIVCQSIINISDAVFIGYERMEYKSVRDIVYSIFKSIMSPLLVYLGYGIVGATIGITIPYIITAILTGFLFYRLYTKESESIFIPFRDVARHIFSYSYPIFLSRLVNGFSSTFFNIVLPIYVGNLLIGNYRAARNFGLLLSLFLTPISTSIFPLYSKLYNNSSSLEEVYYKTIKWLTFISYPVASVLILLSDPLILVLYGNTYEHSSLYLKIFMLHYFFIGFGNNNIKALINSQKKTMVSFHMDLLSVIFSLPIGFLLISRFGIIGLLISQLLISNVGLLYGIVWIKKNLNYGYKLHSTFRILFACIMSYIITFIVINSISLQTILELIIGMLSFMSIFLYSSAKMSIIDRVEAKEIRNMLSFSGPFSKIVDALLNFYTDLIPKKQKKV